MTGTDARLPIRVVRPRLVIAGGRVIVRPAKCQRERWRQSDREDDDERDVVERYGQADAERQGDRKAENPVRRTPAAFVIVVDIAHETGT